MTNIKTRLALAAAFCLLGAHAHAADAPVASHTHLSDCAIQEVLPGKDMTGGYVKLHHKGPTVKLVRAEVPSISARVELHSMEMKNGVMQMRVMTDLDLPEGQRVFKKGADHVMLFDIAQKPAIGSQHTMTIYFSDNTQASCQAVVKSLQDVMKDAGLQGDGEHGHAQQHNKH